MILSYGAAAPATHFESWLAKFFLIGQFVDPNGDLDNDGISNHFEYAFGYGPKEFNASPGFTAVLTPSAAGATNLEVIFRRDSIATDLTYRVQTSSDLSSWTTIALSRGGSATGQNGGVIISDSAIGLPIRLVTVQQSLSAESNKRVFVRLHVERL